MSGPNREASAGLSSRNNDPETAALPPGIKAGLEAVYARYHHRVFVHPDPLELLYHYEDPLDREITGMITSSLAFGRVSQILKSAGTVMARLGKPRAFLEQTTHRQLEKTCAGFRHRFVTERELFELLWAMKIVTEQWGSLEALFCNNYREHHTSVLPALEAFVRTLRKVCTADANYLLPIPERGSACKRLHLFLRWMVRCDAVDPGGWPAVPASRLICPVDTHMHRIGRALGFTSRKQADGRCALELTQALRGADPADPVRFDFALTRLGIRQEGGVHQLLRAFGMESNAVGEVL